MAAEANALNEILTDDALAERWRRVVASLPEPTEEQMHYAEAAPKPKPVARYYDKCMESKTAKSKGKRAASYCGAIAWSIYCKYKNPGSSHCKQGQYFTGKGKPA